jgi:hypothetical protein
LETRRRRSEIEIGRAATRISSLQARMEEIAREQASIKATLERIEQPDATGAQPVTRLARPELELVAPARAGLSIRY